MKKEISQKIITHDTREFFLDESYNLIYRILRVANLGVSRIEFLREITIMLKNFSKCDLIEIRLKERDKYLCCKISKHQKKPGKIEILPYSSDSQKEKTAFREQVYDSRRLSQDMMNEYFLPSHPYVTVKGSFWTCETNKIFELKTDNNQRGKVNKYFIDGELNSLAIIPIIIGEEKIGIMQFNSKQKDFFTTYLIKLYENIAQNIGIAVIDRQTQMSLRERVKELTCLYNITKLIEKSGESFENKLTGIIELLPPALLYPDIASAKIYFDGNSYTSLNYRHNKQNLKVDIIVDCTKRGYVEVTYKKKMAELDLGPFLKEELNLL
ncbi:MAG TPA: hypothetical protein VMW91_04185, partial [Desulfosporosinus sp.]|nr:hypothetical protein [Desulfosporosinus sp.]